MKSINKAQLIAEIEHFADDTPIILNIGTKNYPIETVITGNGNIYLESGLQLGRPRIHKTPEEIEKAKKEKWQRANAKRRNKLS